LVFFTKVEIKSKEDLILLETEDIYLKMVPKEYKYNILESAFDMPSGKGYKHSEDIKRLLSELNKGKKLSEKTKQKISESHKGQKASLETRAKMSQTRLGK